MIKSTRIFKLRRNEYAQTMVEFALVFPLILLITYGIIECGRMVFIYAAVTGAAREGARYGAATGGTIPQFAECDDIREAVQSKVFLITFPNPENDIQISYDSGPGTAKISDCPPPLDIFNHYPISLGDRIIVTATVSYSPVIPLPGIPKEGFNITKQNARTILENIPIKPYP
jgi:hypothetical protein